MWYNVDLRRLGVQLLPPILRSKAMAALVYCLTAPIRWVLAQFSVWREQTDEALGTNATVASIEAALNRLFFLRYRQIYIETPDWEERATTLYLQQERQADTYMRMAGEEKPVYMVEAVEDVPEVNFTVMVPTFLCTSTESRTADEYGWRYLTQIKQLLDKYKPAGRTYRITLYDYE